jgi:exodeoxyribonuclease-5
MLADRGEHGRDLDGDLFKKRQRVVHGHPAAAGATRGSVTMADNISWSPQQEAALADIARWQAEDDPIYKLWGFAGTGKTTLAREVANNTKGRVLFASYTGKAAHVMRKSGCAGATTIHRLIYKPTSTFTCSKHPDVTKTEMELNGCMACPKCGHDLQPGPPLFYLNENSDLRDAELLIIDECSMVDARMALDLLSFDVPILTLGDPVQLPPIDGEGDAKGFFTSGDPDFMLTEIHRQARDNPIIRMSMDVREGKMLTVGTWGESRVARMTNVPNGMNSNMVLVGLNRTRRGFNSHCRRQRGFKTPYPVVGDKLVCRQNDHNIGLLNGTIWFVEHAKHVADRIQLKITPEDDDGDGYGAIGVTTHQSFFDKRRVDWRQCRGCHEFDYSYALTVHTAQGSQWDNVVLMDQSMFFRENCRRWLYTGITRAAERITVLI